MASLRPMRFRVTSSWAATVVALALVLTACGDDATEGDDVSAQQSEKAYVAALEEAVPLAAEAVGATRTEVVGQWESCMGGHQYRGTGALHVGGSGADPAPDQLRSALTGAGWTDVTKVEGHVSVEKDDLTLDLREPGGAFPDLWSLSFHSTCRLLSSADDEYAEKSEPRRIAGG